MSGVRMEPVVVATWSFGRLACEAALPILAGGGAALDAVETGANAVEEDPGVMSVGYGGLPNADGVIELDAAIMEGPGHRSGAVAGLTDIRKPISVARRVMEATPHAMLVGDNARRFAVEQGFPISDLHTEASRERYRQWRRERGLPEVAHFGDPMRPGLPPESHDTVGVCAIDARGDLAAGCTTSGLAWKMPGRVGDSPIVGSGLYVDNEVGCAAATGNGDEILKVCLSYRIVMQMAQGASPGEACIEAIRYLLRKRPEHQQQGAACIAISRTGEVGAAATQEGFSQPDRVWTYAVGRCGEVLCFEGPYVTL